MKSVAHCECPDLAAFVHLTPLRSGRKEEGVPRQSFAGSEARETGLAMDVSGRTPPSSMEIDTATAMVRKRFCDVSM